MSLQAMCSGDATIVPSGLRGYRYWNVAVDGSLRSVGVGTNWRGIECEAACVKHPSDLISRFLGIDSPDHHAPVEGCTCGIYGWYRPDEARLHRGQIFGVIEATGRILLGDFGFRAEHAKVVAVVSPVEMPTTPRALGGVPQYTSVDGLLADYPPEDVRELIGHEIPATPPDDIFGYVMLSFSVDFSQIQRQILGLGVSAAKAAAAMQAAFAQTSQLAQALAPPKSSDPRQRALHARRNRNTGPALPPLGRGR